MNPQYEILAKCLLPTHMLEWFELTNVEVKPTRETNKCQSLYKQGALLQLPKGCGSEAGCHIHVLVQGKSKTCPPDSERRYCQRAWGCKKLALLSHHNSEWKLICCGKRKGKRGNALPRYSGRRPLQTWENTKPVEKAVNQFCTWYDLQLHGFYAVKIRIYFETTNKKTKKWSRLIKMPSSIGRNTRKSHRLVLWFQ